MKKKISAIIYTKDNPNKVINLVDLLYDKIEEILIIDSSSTKNLKIIKNEVEKKSKIYNLPPLGYADPFHKLGAKLAKNNWILHLDDDEIPDKKLLENLKTHNELASYQILRVEKYRKFKNYHPRLYNRKKMVFSGLVHFSLVPLGETKSLDGVLYHYEKPSFNKWKQYALLDAYFFGYKILWNLKKKKYPDHKSKRKKILNTYSELFEKQFIFGKKIGWMLAAFEYLFITTLYTSSMGSTKARLMKILRSSYILSYILNKFSEKIIIWEKLFEAGDLNSYLDLEEIQDFEKLWDKEHHGLNLLIDLITEKIR